MAGSIEQRGEVIRSMLDMATGMMSEAMELPNMESLSITVTQICKAVLAMMAVQGFFKDPALGAIYRSKDKGSWAKFLEIGGAFMAGLLNEPAFHEQFGSELDSKLLDLYQTLDRYFSASLEKEIEVH